MNLSDLIAPLTLRGGAALAAFLAGSGIADDHAKAIAAGVVSLLLVGVDLGQSYLRRKRGK